MNDNNRNMNDNNSNMPNGIDVDELICDVQIIETKQRDKQKEIYLN